MDIRKSVGLKIKEFRDTAGLTQADLAEMIGRSVDTISHLERGISLPNFRTLELLSEKLSIPMRDFFPSSKAELKNAKRTSLNGRLIALANTLSQKELETAVELVDTLARSKQTK